MPPTFTPHSDERRDDLAKARRDLSEPIPRTRAFVLRQVAGPLWRWKLLPPAPMRTGVALTKLGAKAAAVEALETAVREMDLRPIGDPDDPDDLPM